MIFIPKRDSDNSTIADEINILIAEQIKQLPYPLKCTITKVYEDNNHVDISCDWGDLEYVETISSNLSKGHTGILIFLNGSSDEYIVITK